MAALTLLGCGAALAGQAEVPHVRLDEGALTGVLADGVVSYKGIPYAAPPVGLLRWAPPVPPKGWSGERVADDFGPSCMQPMVPRRLPPGSKGSQLSEDCLTLNVWVPPNAKHAPVMVWIHGGGNVNGSSADIYYDGSAFARDGVILVSLNYRLGVFGFFAHPAFAREHAADEGNFGLWDQVAALRWVKHNIARFGGDADNVTLFGESAGGEDTVALLTARAARGLFQRAIAESAGGGWGPPATRVQAESQGVQLATRLKLPGEAAKLSDLRAIPAQQLVIPETEQDWNPIVDGRLLSEPPLSAIAKGALSRVPLVIGTNAEEGSLIPDTASAEGLYPRLSTTDLTQLKVDYGEQASSDHAFAELVFRDAHYAGPARWMARQVAAKGAPVYLYRFGYVMEALRGRRAGARHGSEIPFVFENWPPVRLTDEDRLLGRALHDCWVAFARSGKPDCADAPQWTPLSGNNEWMVFDSQPGMRAIQSKAALDLLETRLGPTR
jgi:para-nitrobenzyl esterase